MHLLPRIHDSLDSLHGAQCFSTRDMRSGYWQVEVDHRDRKKSPFVTPDGLNEFQAITFCLCTAPATFERMIDNMLGGLNWA